MIGPGPLEMGLIMMMSGFFTGSSLLGLPPGDRDATLAQCPPANSVIYMEWSERTIGKAGAKGIDGFAGDPEIRMFIQSIDKAIKSTIERETANGPAEERVLGKAIPEIVKVLLMQPGCMYASFDPKAVGNGPGGMPQWMAAIGGVKAALVVNAGKDADKLAKHISDLLSLLPADLRKKGIDHQPLPIPMPGASMMLHRHKKYFIVGFGKGTVDEAVAGLDGKSKGLLGNARFVSAAKEVAFKRTAMVAWLDLQTALKQAGSILGPQVQGMAKMLGADTLGHVVKSIGVVNGEIRSKSYISTGGKTDGIMALVSGRAIQPADLAHVPADSDLAFAFSMNAPKILETVKKIVAVADPGSKAVLDEILKQFEKEIGLTLEKDLFAAFGDVWVLHDSKSAGGLFLTSLVASLEVRDPQKAEDVFSKLMDVVEEAMPGELRGGFRRRGIYLKQQQFMGHTIHYINTVGDDDVPFAPAFCLTNKHLLAAPHPQALKAQLRFLKSKQPNFTTHFGKSIELPKGELLCLSYAETKSLMQMVYAFAPYFAQNRIQRNPT